MKRSAQTLLFFALFTAALGRWYQLEGVSFPQLIPNEMAIFDGQLPLFPGSPADGIRASIEIQHAIGEHNKTLKEKNLPIIRTGVGLQMGKLMLGILGGEERLKGTVISDSVNLAPRLESLTKQLGATIEERRWIPPAMYEGTELGILNFQPDRLPLVYASKEALRRFAKVDWLTDTAPILQRKNSPF